MKATTEIRNPKTSVLPETIEGLMVKRRLSGSGASSGANVEDADAAVGRADARRSFVIARTEAQEAGYRLRILDELGSATLPAKRGVREAEEPIRILRSIRDRRSQ